MSQVLFVGDGKYLTFDRSWADNGDDPEYAMVGGQKVLIKPRTRGQLPQIFQRGPGFYYKDGSPVIDESHVTHLPKKFREMAEKFITENAGEAKRLKPVATKEEAVEQAVKRGRGRPKKGAAKQVIEIKDEESLRALSEDND